MGFSVLDLFVLSMLISAPMVYFFLGNKQKKKNPRLQKFAKHYGLDKVFDLSSVKTRHNFIILPIDRLFIDRKIVEVCTEFYITPANKKKYIMYSNQHNKFWASYTEHRWDMAIVIAGSLRTAWDSQLTKYYDIMINRCMSFKQKPPSANWNGTILKD
jgi:sensor histidine kinase YesM